MSPRIAFGKPATTFRTLTDDSFLQQLAFSKAAAGKFKQAARQGDADAFARRLKKTSALARPARRGKQVSTTPASAGFASWSQPTSEGSELVGLLEAFGAAGRHAKKKKIAASSKKKSARPAPAADFATLEQQLGNVLGRGDELSPFELHALLELLLTSGSKLSNEVLLLAWRTALQATVDLSAESEQFAETTVDLDQRLLVLGELRFLGGMVFSEIEGADKLLKAGRKSLVQDLLESTDNDGTPRADLLERLPLWIAPLVRSSYWSRELDQPLWDADAEERFQQLLTAVAQFCRVDGRAALSNGFGRDVASLLTWASPLAGWKKNSPPARLLSNIASQKSSVKKRDRLAAEAKSTRKRPVMQSDWARLACLRSDWSPEADSLVVAHHREKPLLDLTACGTQLLEGVWDIDVSVDGKQLEFTDHWTCTCWFSDKDADYLEVQLTFDSGIQVERQLLLSRKSHLVLLADVVSGAGEERIDYVSRLPLVSGIDVDAAKMTRECRLKAGNRRARAFPLALPAERVMGTPGDFRLVDSGLELRQSAIGGLYAPVVLDWDPSRRRSPADWKTLTVTQQRQVLKSDTASGHRLLLGDLHLFVYRSVSKSHEISRAVLGHHTSSETVVGQFDSAGDVDPILIVE